MAQRDRIRITKDTLRGIPKNKRTCVINRLADRFAVSSRMIRKYEKMNIVQ